MRFIDLFAGVGGFHYGITQANPEHQCVYANEWDKYANSVYRKHYGSCDIRDINEVESADIPDHDLLCGGFPCQSFSIAGKRLGFTDTRGILFFEIARIIRDKRPALLLLENVKGLLSHRNGTTFETIMRTLDELGYDLQWQVLNSKDFGVPQNRERVFIIGHLRGKPRPQVFPFTSDRKTDSQQITSTAIDANYWKGVDNHGQRTMIGVKPVVALREVRSEEARKIRSRMLKQGRDWSPRRSKDFVARDDNLIGTVTAARNYDTTLLDGYEVRKLTPVECERLQGFPDNWTQYGADGELISDTQRYKMMGNGVTTSVITEIVKKLDTV